MSLNGTIFLVIRNILLVCRVELNLESHTIRSHIQVVSLFHLDMRLVCEGVEGYHSVLSCSVTVATWICLDIVSSGGEVDAIQWLYQYFNLFTCHLLKPIGEGQKGGTLDLSLQYVWEEGEK